VGQLRKKRKGLLLMFGKKNFRELGGYLIDGLPVPEKSFVQALLYPDKLKLNAVVKEFKPVTKEFELSLEKVKSIRVLSESEIHQVVEQSAPGMIIGAAAFGLIGAMIGGRVKTEEKTVLKSLLLIDYVSNGEKQIVIDCSKAAPSEQSAFLKRFYELKPECNQQQNTPVQL